MANWLDSIRYKKLFSNASTTQDKYNAAYQASVAFKGKSKYWNNIRDAYAAILPKTKTPEELAIEAAAADPEGSQLAEEQRLRKKKATGGYASTLFSQGTSPNSLMSTIGKAMGLK
jgi:hypothetical protein